MPKIPMNYQNSVIYKIVSNNLDVKDCYVGSTTNLDKRRADHKSNHKNPNSKQYNIPLYQFIRENGGWYDFSMVLVENYPCNNKNELHARERYFIENLKAKLNRNIPTRTIKEWREENKDEIGIKQKEYQEDNKDKIKVYKKEYQEDNKDKIKVYRKEYLKDNKDKNKEKQKEYQENNKEILVDQAKIYREKNKDIIKIRKKSYSVRAKDKIKEHRSKKVLCECNIIHTYGHISRHRRSKIHQKYEKHHQLITMNDQLDKIDNEITSEFNRLSSLIIPLIKNV